MDESLRYALALNYAPGIGPVSYFKLLKHFGSAENVFNASASSLRALNIGTNTQNYLKNPNWAQADKELNWASKPGNSILPYSDSKYPELLKKISDAPPLLYIKGNTECLNDLQLAIVGSRNPTPGGRDTAYQFANHLATSGLTISSGLALGIDSAAHEGVLAASASTIAVMGTGMDQIYPAQNIRLAEQIIEKGALISEFPLGTKALAQNFPKRNRIVSALSLGCLVVEAALRSGSLITARFALEQGREVFAIPGSIHNPLAKGCHQLIREGAKLVETSQDIIVEISAIVQSYLNGDTHTYPAEQYPETRQSESPDTTSPLDNEYQTLLDAIAHDPVSADLLIERTGFNAQTVSSMLLMLELKGYISSNPGGTYIRNNL